MWRILRYLVGPDAFISYARADAGAYADRLNDRLKSEKGISVYLDQEQSPVGAELPASLRRELRLSRRLVVIVSDAATASENVQREVEEFGRHPRPVIPIDCLGESPRPTWPGLTGAYWREESAEKRTSSTPSDEIIGEIVGAIGADRQSRRTRRAAWWTAAFVIAAAVGSAVMIGFAQVQAEKARTSESIATLSAQRQKRLASAAERARDLASQEALRQQQIAQAMAMVNAADTLMAADPRRREQALLMNMVALRRLEDLRSDSHAATSALRARLEQTGRLRKTIPWDSKAEGAVISLDGRLVAAVAGNSIRLIDVASGHRRFLRPPNKAASIERPRFSDDGSHLAAIVDHKTLMIWRTADGSVATAFKAPITYFRDFALSPRGDAYAAVEYLGDPTQRYDESPVGENLYVQAVVPESKPERMLHRDAFAEITFSSDANLLGVCAEPAGVWNLRSEDEQRTQLIALPRCDRLLFSDEGTIAISISGSFATAYDISAAPSNEEEPPALWTSNAWRAAIHGGRIAIARYDAIEVREIASGSVVSQLPFPRASGLAMNGDFIAALSDGGRTSAIYHLDGMEAHRGHLSYASAIALSANGEAVVATERGVEVWNDAGNGLPRWIVSRHVVGDLLEAQVSVAPDGRYLVAAEETQDFDRHVLRVYDLTTMKLVTESPPVPQVKCLAAGIGVVAFSSEPGREVQIWKWRERKSVPRRLFQENDLCTGLQISPSGNFIAVKNVWDNISLRHLATPEKLIAKVPLSILPGFTFGESDDELITLDLEGLRLFKIANGRAEVVVSTAGTINSDLLASLGGGLVALNEENEVVLRDLRAPNAPVVERLDHGALVRRLAAAPGLIGSVGIDGIFHLWRPRIGEPTEEVARIRVADRDVDVTALLIGAGAQVLVASDSQRLEVRPLTAAELLRVACARLASTASADPDYRAACAAH